MLILRAAVVCSICPNDGVALCVSLHSFVSPSGPACVTNSAVPAEF
jgi:hypothetical protein